MHLTKIRLGKLTRVDKTTARRVAEFYDRHSMDPLDDRSAKLSKITAAKKNWVPPLGWDDIDRDTDPAI